MPTSLLPAQAALLALAFLCSSRIASAQFGPAQSLTIEDGLSYRPGLPLDADGDGDLDVLSRSSSSTYTSLYYHENMERVNSTRSTPSPS